jgi:uncharacterized protein (DUF4415 family)
MSAKSRNTKTSSWVDPDDAPELTGEELEHPQGVWRRGNQILNAEEGKTSFRRALGKQQVQLLLDRDIIEYFMAKAGRGSYQALINKALRQAMERETLEGTLRRIIREELRERR